MRWKGWERTELRVPDPADPSRLKEAVAMAPLIISASRSTDIPAFYGDWFAARLDAGYAKWRSPFSGEPVYVSFSRARVFAFWSKNPAPFFPCLDLLDTRRYGYFFLFTLNDYENEGLEPGIPPLEERISTFMRLSRRTGAGRIVWRFDPLLLSDTISVDDLLDRIGTIGNLIHPFTRRLVISFIDIRKYRKVRRSLATAGCRGVREFSDEEITMIAQGLSDLNQRWGLSLSACGERRDLSEYGVGQGRCIGYDLLVTEFASDPDLMKFLAAEPGGEFTGLPPAGRRVPRLKDPGQRSTCGCVVSKDIGQYSTCPHRCVYCYANASGSHIERQYQQYLEDAAGNIFHESIIE